MEQKRRRRSILKGISALSLSITIAGCGGSDKPSGVVIEDYQTKEKSLDGYGVEILVENTSDEPAGDFLVAAVFYAGDVLLDEDWERIELLNASESKEVWISFTGSQEFSWDDVTDYKVELR